MAISAKRFVDRFGRRVLTDEGKQGLDGRADTGSTTEILQGRVAASIFQNCGPLDNAQLDEIIGWVSLYKTRP